MRESPLPGAEGQAGSDRRGQRRADAGAPTAPGKLPGGHPFAGPQGAGVPRTGEKSVGRGDSRQWR